MPTQNKKGVGFCSKLYHETTDIFLTSENEISLRTALQKKNLYQNQNQTTPAEKTPNLEISFINVHCQKSPNKHNQTDLG